eukprot:1157829-Pelagomonas_calceolata.AAC.4
MERKPVHGWQRSLLCGPVIFTPGVFGCWEELLASQTHGSFWVEGQQEKKPIRTTNSNTHTLPPKAHALQPNMETHRAGSLETSELCAAAQKALRALSQARLFNTKPPFLSPTVPGAYSLTAIVMCIALWFKQESVPPTHLRAPVRLVLVVIECGVLHKRHSSLSSSFLVHHALEGALVPIIRVVGSALAPVALIDGCLQVG